MGAARRSPADRRRGRRPARSRVRRDVPLATRRRGDRRSTPPARRGSSRAATPCSARASWRCTTPSGRARTCRRPATSPPTSTVPTPTRRRRGRWRASAASTRREPSWRSPGGRDRRPGGPQDRRVGPQVGALVRPVATPSRRVAYGRGVSIQRLARTAVRPARAVGFRLSAHRHRRPAPAPDRTAAACGRRRAAVRRRRRTGVPQRRRRDHRSRSCSRPASTPTASASSSTATQRSTATRRRPPDLGPAAPPGPMTIDRIPLPRTDGALWLCGRNDVGPDPEAAMA